MMGEFVTRRLRLRRWRAEDAPRLAALNADAEVMRYIGSGAPAYHEALAEAEAFVAAPPDGPLARWAIEDRADGAFHGWVGLLPFDDTDEVEIAFRLARASWGRGIATEAARRVIDHGFADLHLARIVAVTAPGNRASRRVLEKLGLEHRGHRTAYGVAGCWYCVLTRADWETGTAG